MSGGPIGHRGLLAGAAGVAAVGALAGMSVARSVSRRGRRGDDPWAGEDFERLDADPGCVVTTGDGVDLAVREVGPGPDDPPAAVTVVFVHGLGLRMAAWHCQRVALAQRWGDQVRMVFYDQRGHGRSDVAPPETYTVGRLGEDLETVLTVMAPRGPVVLVGHSMGGMAILAHAGRYPHRYRSGGTVVGVALLASAARGLADSPLGQVLRNPALRAARAAVRQAPGLVHRGRGLARSVLRPVLTAGSYGSDDVSPAVAAFSEKMLHDASATTLVEFLRALGEHDETAALPVLADLPVLVAVGERDMLTPVAQSEEMADALPGAELLTLPDTGHLIALERPDVVDDALVRLVERATPSRLTALSRRLRARLRPDG